jgi:hypothetical protein
LDRWDAKQFASAESFYDEASKQLAGRTAGAMKFRLYILELTVPSDGTGGRVPSWSESEHDLLMDTCCQCNTGQIGSGEKLSEHLAERLPGRSAKACYKQIRKLGHDVPQVLQQILNTAQNAANAAAKRDEHGAAVALKVKPPLWLPDEDSALKHLMSQWCAKQFASAHDFYSEAVKRLQGRSAGAIEKRLRRLKITHPPSTRNYKPADQRDAPAQPPAHAAAAADVAAVVKDDISDDTPLPAQPQSTLPPPPPPL